MELLDLPQELLDHLLSYLPPSDIIHFGQSCKRSSSFIDPSNQVLWQSAFLQRFDDPQEAWMSLTPTARRLNTETEQSWDWYLRLRGRLYTLHATANHLNAKHATISYEDKIAAILELIDTARPGPSTISNESYGNLNSLPTLYQLNNILDTLIRFGDPDISTSEPPRCPDASGNGPILLSPTRPTTRSMSHSQEAHRINARPEAACRLHVLAGLTPKEIQDTRSLGLARRTVYDWDKTTSENDYGPFVPDGNVDWRRLEAVVSVSTRHFSRAVQSRLTLPQGFQYSVPHLTKVDPGFPEDWAGVTGSWCGTYVFLNWENLMDYNATANMDLRPSLEDGPESCGGLMKLDLKLNEELSEDSKLRVGLPFCEDLKPLYFQGVSRSWDFQMATGVRGMCCLTPNGREVRWKFIIKYACSFPSRDRLLTTL